MIIVAHMTIFSFLHCPSHSGCCDSTAVTNHNNHYHEWFDGQRNTVPDGTAELLAVPGHGCAAPESMRPGESRLQYADGPSAVTPGVSQWTPSEAGEALFQFPERIFLLEITGGCKERRSPQADEQPPLGIVFDVELIPRVQHGTDCCRHDGGRPSISASPRSCPLHLRSLLTPPAAGRLT